MPGWGRVLRAAGRLRSVAASPGAARGASRGPGERPGGRGAALPAGPDLRHFLRAAAVPPPAGEPRPEPERGAAAGPGTVYLETYGCQMNVNDTEIAWAILQKNGYTRTKDVDELRRERALNARAGSEQQLLSLFRSSPSASLAGQDANAHPQPRHGGAGGRRSTQHRPGARGNGACGCGDGRPAGPGRMRRTSLCPRGRHGSGSGTRLVHPKLCRDVEALGPRARLAPSPLPPDASALGASLVLGRAGRGQQVLGAAAA